MINPLKTRFSFTEKLFIYLQMLCVSVGVLGPIFWMLTSAFKAPAAVTAYPPRLLFEPTLENFQTLFQRTPFLEYGCNSFIIAGTSTALGLLLALPAAFACSWYRTTWPALITLVARMAPGTLFLLPWYVLFSELGLIGTYWALILTHTVITMPVALWIMLSFFEEIPRDITECALIDGCTLLQSLLLVGIPLARPGIIVSAILCFIFSWNYFLFALVLSGFRTKPLTVAAFNFVGEGVTNYGALMAAASLIALPPLVLAFIVQRWLVSGLSLGAVKG